MNGCKSNFSTKDKCTVSLRLVNLKVRKETEVRKRQNLGQEEGDALFWEEILTYEITEKAHPFGGFEAGV